MLRVALSTIDHPPATSCDANSSKCPLQKKAYFLSKSGISLVDYWQMASSIGFYRHAHIWLAAICLANIGIHFRLCHTPAMVTPNSMLNAPSNVHTEMSFCICSSRKLSMNLIDWKQKNRKTETKTKRRGKTAVSGIPLGKHSMCADMCVNAVSKCGFVLHFSWINCESFFLHFFFPSMH